MLNAHNPPFPKNYVCIVASEPDLHSAFFRDVTGFLPYSANLKPFLL